MYDPLKTGLVLALSTIACGAFSLPAAAQHTYDASADFSTATNASPLDGGVWSYGTETTLGKAFSLNTQSYTFTGNVSGAVQGWAGTDGGFPYVTQNTGSTTFDNVNGNTTILVMPGQMDLHPGPNGEYGVVRFTAPTTAAYSFNGSFSGVNSNPTTTDVHVLLDGNSIADGGINVNGGGNSVLLASNSLSLTKGDTLDFVVGYGNGSYFNDSTGLYAQVTNLAAVPEDSTTVSLGLLLTLGFSGMAISARRKLQKRG